MRKEGVKTFCRRHKVNYNYYMKYKKRHPELGYTEDEESVKRFRDTFAKQSGKDSNSIRSICARYALDYKDCLRWVNEHKDVKYSSIEGMVTTYMFEYGEKEPSFKSLCDKHGVSYDGFMQWKRYNKNKGDKYASGEEEVLAYKRHLQQSKEGYTLLDLCKAYDLPYGTVRRYMSIYPEVREQLGDRKFVEAMVYCRKRRPSIRSLCSKNNIDYTDFINWRKENAYIIEGMSDKEQVERYIELHKWTSSTENTRERLYIYKDLCKEAGADYNNFIAFLDRHPEYEQSYEGEELVHKYYEWLVPKGV